MPNILMEHLPCVRNWSGQWGYSSKLSPHALQEKTDDERMKRMTYEVMTKAMGKARPSTGRRVTRVTGGGEGDHGCSLG